MRLDERDWGVFKTTDTDNKIGIGGNGQKKLG